MLSLPPKLSVLYNLTRSPKYRIELLNVAEPLRGITTFPALHQRELHFDIFISVICDLKLFEIAEIGTVTTMLAM